MESTKERNQEIYAARAKGTCVAELSKKYGVSERRIRAICKQQEERKVKESDLLYMAIRLLTNDIKFAGTVYGILKRNGIDTVEKAKSLTSNDLKKMRCCGPKMMELLKNFQSIAGGK